MKYDNPELLEKLAAEYVLGTLRGKARDRFFATLRTVPDARAAVRRWELRLQGLNGPLKQTAPPAHVWARIEARLHKNVISFPQKTQPTLSSNPLSANHLWKGISALAAAAVVVLAILVIKAPNPVSTADHVALFSNQQAQPQWLVSVDMDNGSLTARALNVAAANAESAFELWMLPGGNAAPRSLGLLPTADHSIQAKLPVAAVSQLRTAAALAISLEPAGGSPTGLPTGPVLYQAPLLRL